MNSISTRDLVHRTKEVRNALLQGETLEWTSRGKAIAVLEPVRKELRHKEPDHWLRRATQVGSVMPADQSASKLVYDERG